MKISTDMLLRILSERSRGTSSFLVGCTLVSLLLVAISYLKDRIDLSSDSIAIVAIMLLIVGWGVNFYLTSANEKRANRLGEILSNPRAARLTIQKDGQSFILEQVGRIESAMGEFETSVGDRVVISRDEAERIGLNSAGLGRPLLMSNTSSTHSRPMPAKPFEPTPAPADSVVDFEAPEFRPQASSFNS